MQEGKITLIVETWSNNGKGNWRSCQKAITFEQYYSLRSPLRGEMIEREVETLRDKVNGTTLPGFSPR